MKTRGRSVAAKKETAKSVMYVIKIF